MSKNLENYIKRGCVCYLSYFLLEAFFYKPITLVFILLGALIFQLISMTKLEYSWSNTALTVSGLVLLISSCIYNKQDSFLCYAESLLGFIFGLAGRELNRINYFKRKDNGEI